MSLTQVPTTMMKNFNAPNLQAGDVLTFDGNQWVVQPGTPAGTVVQFAGVTPPIGWLLCDGSAVSRASYAGLFAAIGTIYGEGDGSSTFAIPDMRGRSVFGLDDMGGTAAERLSLNNELGYTGGAQTKSTSTDTHVLTAAQIPSHYHLQGGNTTSTLAGRFGNEYAGSAGGYYETGGSYSGTYAFKTSSVGADEGHAHNLKNLDVMPPFILMNYIIKC